MDRSGWTAGVRRARTVLVVGAIVLTMTACGAGGQDDPADSAAPADHSSTPTPVATPSSSTPGRENAAADPMLPVGQVTYRFANGKGYERSMRIALWRSLHGAAVAQAHHPWDRDAGIGKTCDFDPARDLAIPAGFEVTGRTRGFPTAAAASALFVHDASQGPYAGEGPTPTNDDDRLAVEQYFSDGPRCTTLSSTNLVGYGEKDPFSVSWVDDVGLGRSARAAFTIIVHDYYSPSTPGGDEALLRYVALRAIGGLGPPSPDLFKDQDCSYLGFYSCRGLSLDGHVAKSARRGFS